MDKKGLEERKSNKRKAVVFVTVPLFAVIIALCSVISVPFTVPFTLQSFGVFFALCFLGGRNGTLSLFIYLALGAVGFPVFSGGGAGVGVLFGFTGGYLFGWLAAGFCVMLFERIFGERLTVRAVAVSVGLLLCYCFGTLWFVVCSGGFSAVSLWSALCTCVFPFVVFDIIKLFLAVFLCGRLARIIKKRVD